MASNNAPSVQSTMKYSGLGALVQEALRRNPSDVKLSTMSYDTSRGRLKEQREVLIYQQDHVQWREEEARRAKPTMAVPKSEASSAPKGEASGTIVPRRNNGFQIQADTKDRQSSLRRREYTGRRNDAVVLDMDMKLDTYYIETGSWIYMSKNYKEEVFDWCAFEEESHSGATF